MVLSYLFRGWGRSNLPAVKWWKVMCKVNVHLTYGSQMANKDIKPSTFSSCSVVCRVQKPHPKHQLRTHLGRVECWRKKLGLSIAQQPTLAAGAHTCSSGMGSCGERAQPRHCPPAGTESTGRLKPARVPALCAAQLRLSWNTDLRVSTRTESSYSPSVFTKCLVNPLWYLLGDSGRSIFPHHMVWDSGLSWCL